MSAWWTRRSMRAMAVAALGKMVGHSLNGKLVVNTRLRFSYRRVTTWKRRAGARAAWDRDPTSSINKRPLAGEELTGPAQPPGGAGVWGAPGEGGGGGERT